MSLSGNLHDVALVDLLQFVHLSGRSGTLFLERNGEQAHIAFHRGRIVAAWCPTAPSVTSILQGWGVLDEAGLARALEAQSPDVPVTSLGQALIATGAVTAAKLKEAITNKVEKAIYDLIGWTRGRFRFVVDEIRGDHEIALSPGDVVPELDINTQMVLMEALRLFDERNHSGEAASATPAAPVVPSTVAMPGVAIHVVSGDTRLVEELATLLREHAKVKSVRLRDAGIQSPGQEPPIVVLDCRAGAALDDLKRIRAQHARAVPIVIPPTGAIADAYAAGAIAVLPPDAAAIASCCASLLVSRNRGSEEPEVDLRAGLARLRRVLGDLRSGLLSATMSLNLMTIVADSLERAVLFVVQRNGLQALGAFGQRGDGKQLAQVTSGLVLKNLGTTAVAQTLAEGRACIVEHSPRNLPEELIAAIDRPGSGQVALFPVLGSRRVIALIYADHGKHDRPIDDVEIMEIATAQVGLAFENELLRRQIDRKEERRA
jgi:hypothetical protein